ncbi:hypothetical protein LshimejAT787_1203320 [Lyophyllum shimeji]|uniref:Uncharacterized protein n=1 Tax=Lyophyllum shimeji TaxID=47721 RepID=A0A9P3PVP8_LYOSH|nr:hypothetical protein LshimejAT787_1203320 [Lyophyllum shimeji]
MGQRHQVFLIARVVPHGETKAYYRCVAALHHQWCYGRLPLHATRRMLSLIKKEDNAEIIREELRLLNEKYGRWRQKPLLPDVPCPYTSFLLATSWNLDFSDPLDPYVSGVSLYHAQLDADMGSSEGDNNDGITVIDITDPEDPAYCFVSATGLESEESVPHRVPLSATDYVRAYYPVPSEVDLKEERARLVEDSVQQTIAALDGVKLVELEMLAEAWPQEYRNSLAAQKDEATKAVDDSEVPPVPPPVTADPAAIPSLADLSVRPAVEHALELGETEDIEQLIWLPGKAEAIIEALKPRDPFPDSGLDLLSKTLSKTIRDDVLDLSDTFLSTEQITSLLADFPTVKTLKLSRNPVVTVDTIKSILASTPSLRRLVLLNTQIANADLSNLLSTSPKLFYHLEALVHPLFYSSPTKAPFPSAFAYIGIVRMMRAVAAASLPFFTPALVVQALTDYLSGYLDMLASSSLLTATLAPQAVFSSEVRKEGVTWVTRSVPMVAPPGLRALVGKGGSLRLSMSCIAIGRM